MLAAFVGIICLPEHLSLAAWACCRGVCHLVKKTTISSSLFQSLLRHLTSRSYKGFLLCRCCPEKGQPNYHVSALANRFFKLYALGCHRGLQLGVCVWKVMGICRISFLQFATVTSVWLACPMGESKRAPLAWYSLGGHSAP